MAPLPPACCCVVHNGEGCVSALCAVLLMAELRGYHLGVVLTGRAPGGCRGMAMQEWQVNGARHTARGWPNARWFRVCLGAVTERLM